MIGQIKLVKCNGTGFQTQNLISLLFGTVKSIAKTWAISVEMLLMFEK